jgi:SAM-dependent methyltransferase
MKDAQAVEGRGYEKQYRAFDSPLMRQVRAEAYGTDIGQHSWVTAEELEHVVACLRLSRTSHFLDLGCGPGGPLAFVVGKVGCRGRGVDLSAEAIVAGRARAAALGVEALVTLRESDLNEPLPFSDNSLDAVMSLDVVLHLRDRAQVFQEVARVLVPGGRFLFTDAGVIAGPVSDEEIQMRSIHGYTQFVPHGFNEKALELSGLRLIEQSDCTASLLRNARGRHAARLAHRPDLDQVEGSAAYELEQRYLQTVITLAERGAVSRMMYLAESRTT